MRDPIVPPNGATDYFTGKPIKGKAYRLITVNGDAYVDAKTDAGIIYSEYYRAAVPSEECVECYRGEIVLKIDAVYSDYYEAYIPTDDAIEVINNGGDYVYEDDAIWSDYYDGYIIDNGDVVECEGGEIIYNGDAVYSDYYDAYIPYNHATEVNDVWIYDDDEDAYNELERGIYIHSYGYTPRFTVKKLSYENTITMGFELEVCTETPKDDAERLIKFWEKSGVSDRYYICHDGSISKGFEIISQPATLQWMHKNGKIYEMMKWLKENDFFIDRTVGLHIHMKSDKFTNRMQGMLAEFITQNFERLRPLFRRGYSGYAGELDSSDIEDFYNGMNIYSRYKILNNNGIGLEFRMFKSTLKHSNLIAALQFVDAIVSFFEWRGGHKIPSWKEFYDYVKRFGYGKVYDVLRRAE